MSSKLRARLVATLGGLVLGLSILAGCYVDPAYPPPGPYYRPYVVPAYYGPWYGRPYHHYRHWWGRHHWVPGRRDHGGRWRHGHWRRRW